MTILLKIINSSKNTSTNEVYEILTTIVNIEVTSTYKNNITQDKYDHLIYLLKKISWLNI